MASQVQCTFCGKAGDHGHRVGIVGSRDFPEMGLVREFVAKIPGLWTVVSGGARGVDREAERWARKNGLKLEVIRAKWDELGKSAGFKRNEELVEAVDCLVAFWDGQSSGTAHVVKLAQQRLGTKRVRVIAHKLSPEQRQHLAQAAGAKAGAVARGEAASIHDQIEMTREWNQTQAAWRDALGATEEPDVEDDERELERRRWDDRLHPVSCGVYAGSYDKLGTWQPAGWDDPLELAYGLDDEGLIANWEELSGEDLDFIDACADPFWAPIFRKCAREHKPITPKMLDMAQHPRFA